MRISPLTELTASRADLASSRVASDATTPQGDAEATAPSSSFADVLESVVGVANQADAEASKKVDALARGLNDDLHGTMIAVKEADISVKLVASIRNKLLDAFNDIWKTNV